MTPLHSIGDFVRELLLQIPLPTVRVVFLAVPTVILTWVLRLSHEATTPPDGAGRWDENLKVWAGLALAIQIVIYSML